MSRRWVGLGIALVTLLMIGSSDSSVSAAPIHGKKILAPNPAIDWVIAKARDSILRRLELSNDQWLAIHQILDEHSESLWDEIVAAKEARRDLVDQIRAEDLDAEAIELSHTRVAETELQLLIHTAVVLQEVKQHLTPAQLAEIDLIVEEVFEGAKLRFEDLEKTFASGDLLGRKWRKRANKAVAD